ncbi:MAG TPA: DNA internalization-related competence protein ComEC/Rec2, partial [Gemmatimonadaceae bacterium]|nr:DNA internalization-related competence protein ComEC/Rec2 [Gemmatimonadaceae bacterium]
HDPAYPGAYVRGRARLGRCEVEAAVLVRSGVARAGAVVVARGSASPTRRGIRIQHAVLRATGEREILPAVRGRIAASIDRSFRDDAPLARALLIADQRSIDPAMRERFAAAGLVHMLSISGLHVALIAAAVQLLCLALRLSRTTASATTMVITAGYVAVIGVPAPALRAGVMLGVAAMSRFIQRPTSPWSGLAIGAAAPLVNPHTMLDLGYQLSVAGMAGLIGSGALARRWIAPRWSGWRAQAASIALASVVTTVVTAPLVAWNFGRLSLVSPVANLIATPLVAGAQPALFLAMLAGPLPEVSRFLADAVHPVLRLLDTIAAYGASLPFASTSIAPTRTAALLAGAATVGLLVACVTHFPARALIFTLATLTTATWLPLAPARSGEVELHMIDVGQGDAVALRTPRGRWVLFDAGRGWRGGDAGRSVIIPYLRARGGDLVAFVLSHPHTDHAGGASSVVTALRPLSYWDGAYAGASESYRASLAAAQERALHWRRARPGDSLEADGVIVRFLAPDSAWLVGLDDPNEASVVALVRYGGIRFLLVGDAERGEERWLLDHAAELLRADVLKVGHHGSSTSTTAAFLAAVQPRVALISVGAGNSYNHPSPVVLRSLASAGATVLRTDRQGSVVVRSDGRSLWVDSEGDSWTISP